MSARKQLRVSVARDGTVAAETLGFAGPECLDQIAVLEDLLDALSVSSSFTADYHRDAAVAEEVQRHESRQG